MFSNNQYGDDGDISATYNETSNNSQDEVSVSIKSDLAKNGKNLSGGWQRRRSIPERANHSLNLWSIMKNCIGKELTRIPMPGNTI